jgi:hypothetical protein
MKGLVEKRPSAKALTASILFRRLVRMSEWDIDSKVINVEVRVNPNVITYDTEEVANCSINLDYMEDNKIK